jgi:hypothetical protein
MGRSGFQAAYSSVPGLGITGLIISTVTWITISTIARVITAPCPHAVKLLLNTVRNSTARRCTTRAATKLRVAANRARGVVECFYFRGSKWTSTSVFTLTG